MAKRKPKASKGEDAPREKNPKRDLLQRIHDRYHLMVEADQENRRAALADLRFVNVPGEQWDQDMKKERGDRPCYEFNKLRINGKRVINEIRANRPSGKVRAVEGGDKETADLYEGLCRNIAAQSDLDTITDNAAEYQVDAGMTNWRVVRKYAADDVFDQDLLIEGIKNPFCLWVDPGCKDPLKRDAEDWILEDRISKEAFEAKYKGKEVVNFESEGGFDDLDDWEDDETVRIVEYWYREPYEKEIWLVAFPQEDGTVKRITVDSTTDEAEALRQTPGYEQQIVKRRMAKCHRIKMCLASGEAILSESDEIGTQFPFIMVFGESKVIEGKTQWHGLHRFSKDAQKSYNLNRTASDEAVFAAVQAKWWATAKQAEGHTTHWAEAHKKNFPYMLYTPDPAAPGPPIRMASPDVPMAFTHQAINAAQDVRDTSGLHEAAFGEESDEKSGIALARKQNQAQIVTYNFPDNMAKGVKRTWEILIDYIPHVYDAERELRILGADGAEDYVKVNQIVQDPRTGQAVRVNDVTTGKYDVVVTTGPNFATQRMEATEIYGELAAKFPAIMQVAGDLIMKAMDLPYSDDMAERFKHLLLPAVQQQIAEGKELPPEVVAAQAQVQQAMQLVQQQGMMVQQAAQEAEQSKAEAEKAKADVQTAIANLKTEEARFQAAVAKVEAQFAQREAQFAEKQATAGQDGEREKLGNELAQAITQLQQQAAQFQQEAVSTLAQIMAKQQTQVNVPASPRVRAIRSGRDQSGGLIAIPEYEDAAPTGSVQ